MLLIPLFEYTVILTLFGRRVTYVLLVKTGFLSMLPIRYRAEICQPIR